MKSKIMTLAKCCLMALYAMLSYSCTKPLQPIEPEPVAPPLPATGHFKVQFRHVSGEDSLLFTKEYVNSSGEPFKVISLSYYVTNFKLTQADGMQIVIPNTYFIVNAENRSTISIQNVPLGNYKGMTFLLGVDSARTKQGGYTGDLEPTKGMFWNTWALFMNFKLDGISPVLKTNGKVFSHHTAGYEAPNSALRWVEMNFSEHRLIIKKDTVPVVKIKSDVQKVFEGPSRISIKAIPVWEGIGDTSRMFANNYQHMFSFDTITTR